MSGSCGSALETTDVSYRIECRGDYVIIIFSIRQFCFDSLQWEYGWQSMLHLLYNLMIYIYTRYHWRSQNKLFCSYWTVQYWIFTMKIHITFNVKISVTPDDLYIKERRIKTSNNCVLLFVSIGQQIYYSLQWRYFWRSVLQFVCNLMVYTDKRDKSILPTTMLDFSLVYSLIIPVYNGVID